VDSVVRALANGSKCAVLAIDYSLAPEHKYPAVRSKTSITHSSG